jgi:hypothetical protein
VLEGVVIVVVGVVATRSRQALLYIAMVVGVTGEATYYGMKYVQIIILCVGRCGQTLVSSR